MSELNLRTTKMAKERLQSLSRQTDRETRASQIVAGSFLLGVGLGVLLHKRRHRREFLGQTVLITGGSRGLGLEMVQEFSERGAQVVFCARTADEVTRAEQLLHQQGFSNAKGMVADIGRPNGPSQLIAQITREVGPIDILVNNAGQIQVAPFVDTEEEAFHRCLDLFLYGPLRLSREVLPAMMASGGGSIVNITSVGGQVPAPHLVPYNCGKAALVALSEGMSVEMDRYGIHVMTVVPGLMRTGSHRNAMFGGRRAEEYAWFRGAALHPVLAQCAKSAARSVVDGVAAKRRTLSLGWEAKWGPFLHAFFPEMSHRITSAVEKLLPDAGAAPPLKMGEMVAQEAPPLGALMDKLERRALEMHQSARFSVVSTSDGGYPEA